MAKNTVQSDDIKTAGNGENANRVYFSVGKTMNLGNYETLRVDVGIGRAVEEGEKFKAVLEVCKKEAMAELQETLKILERK